MNSKIPHGSRKRLHLGVLQVLCFRFHAARHGFTMVEIVIMLAIIISISAIVLVSFPNVSGNINMQKSVQKFSLSFRQMQDHALAVREVEGPSGPVIPSGVGVYATLAAPAGYILFGDMNANRMYDAGTDAIISTVLFERGVRLIRILDELNQDQTVANVIFSVPDATLRLFNDSQTIGESVLFTLHGDGALADRSVRVRTSGQISTE